MSTFMAISEDRSEFNRSLVPLARLAMRESGADGFSFYSIDPRSGALTELCSAGSVEAQIGGTSGAVTSFPMPARGKVTGLLTFHFRASSVPAQSQAVVEEIAGAAEAFWDLSRRPEAYTRPAAALEDSEIQAIWNPMKVGELEVAMADSKIAERARGLLARGGANAVDIVARPVRRGGSFAPAPREPQDSNAHPRTPTKDVARALLDQRGD
jgi:hypothetical protein